jgi:MoaA/NifB/PqqE/SkfB family radical SAM enzyme
MIPVLLKAMDALLRQKILFDIDLIPFYFEKVPYKKILNWFLTESSVLAKPGRPWGLPTVLQVEPTAHCNLRCRGCPVTTGMDRPSGHMDKNLFTRLIDELADYLLLILFWDWGEPFLNPSAFEMIHYARSRGIKVISSTNGHVFAEGDHARNVVESGLDVLVFSLDGLTQETYETYRARGRLERVIEGIRRVEAQKGLLRSDTPLINVRFIAMRHNEHEIPMLPGFARSLGVDSVTVRKFFAVPNSWEGTEDQGSPYAPGRAEFRLPEIRGENHEALRVSRNRCKTLWNCPTVHWDGTVCSCFLDFNEDRPLGNLAHEGFREIWCGRPYRMLRRAFREDWQNLRLCRECSCGFKGGDIGRESNVEITFFPKN